LYEVATGMELYSPRDVSDRTLVAAIEDALSSGKLLLVPGWTPGFPGEVSARRPQPDDLTEEGRLLTVVMGGRRSLEFEGNKYRFVVLDRAPYRPSGRDEYRPMAAPQARALLERMSERLAKTPEQRTSWQRLADKLAEWHSGAGSS
jgi:hypothetical protein